jgi:Ran GTPase-activating protein (RanGAP) involved in mRNA processing and transport
MYRSRSAPEFVPVEAEKNVFTPRSAYIAKCAETSLTPMFLGDRNCFDLNTGSLDCASFGIGDPYILALAGAAMHFPHLCVLKMASNSIADATASQIVAQLNARDVPVLQIDFSNNKIARKTAVEISRLMKNPKCPLRDLNLERNFMKDIPTAQLHVGLSQKHTTLTRLNLSHNEISCLGVEALAHAIIKNSSLVALSLGWNKIRSRGASALFDVYRTNRVLECLGARMHMQTINFHCFFSVLTFACNCCRTDLSWNGVCSGGTAGVESMGRAFRRKTCPLMHLDLSYNRISKESCDLISHSLQNNHSLLGLHISAGNISAYISQPSVGILGK